MRYGLRILELEYPVYTKVGAGDGVFILNAGRVAAVLADSTPEETADGCVQRFR